MEDFVGYDIEAGYVSSHVYRPMRSIELVINSVRNYTNWELIVAAFDIIGVYNQCNLLISHMVKVESDHGTDLLRLQE